MAKPLQNRITHSPANLIPQVKQDSVKLIFPCTCEATTGFAPKIKKIEFPQQSKNSFVLLKKNGLLSLRVSNILKKMMMFNNIAVYDCQELNIKSVKQVIENPFSDVGYFINEIQLHAIGLD